MSGPDFFVCPHCQAQRPRWQVCPCPGAVAARKVRRVDRERRAELRTLGVPVPPHRLRQGGRVKGVKG